MSPTQSSWRSDKAAVRRWRPLPLMDAFGDHPGFVLAVIWIALTAICVWWPLADNGLIPRGAGFTWNRWDITLFSTPLIMHLYLPWVVSVCLVMWLGFEWAAVPAYMATLFSTLYKEMPADLAVVNALHNPLAMAVYFLFYCNYKGDYTLRSWRSWGWFLLASTVASLVSSLGAFISEFTGTALVGGGSILEAWLGWVPNAFLLSVAVSAPLILLFSPTVERLKQRHFQRWRIQTYTQRELVLAASMFALMLVLFLVAEDQWMSGRVHTLLQGSMPEIARTGIEAQFASERSVIWLLALLLAGISLGGVFFTSRWVERLHLRYDSQTREARDALKRSESNFRNFFENSPVPMLLYDRDTGDFVDVNRAALDIYGYTRGEFLEMTIFDIRPPEDVAKLKAYFKEVGRGNLAHHAAGEWRHLTKDGAVLHVEIRVSALVMDNRALFLAAVHDISPRKTAQAAIERRARELQQLAASSLEIAGARTVEEVLQVAADRARELSGAHVGIARVMPGQVRASLSDKYAAWRGPGRLPDTEDVWQVLIRKRYTQRLSAAEVRAHPDYPRFQSRQGSLASIGALLAVPLARSDSELMGALIVVDKGGVDFDAEDESILVQLGQVAAAAIESVGLKEALQQHMQELEERVRQRTAELDNSNQELDAFAYSIAHDLRAPLRAMHGFADAVLEDYASKLDESGRDYLKRIIKSAKNMDALIQDLLAYSRISREKTELEGVMLADTVQETLADLHAEIEATKAKIDVSVPPLTVLAHRATLRTVFLNLVSNALKFMAPGETPWVRIWATSRDGMIDISVRDNGIGIAQEHRERIFNVFERLHGAEAYPGTGIGLSIVKKGLARMQGEVSVESGEEGSTFLIRLKEYRDG